jgi:BirA family biotin operon repressor/biotin-[acetyl-CoA-carboxylase] ligase
VVIGIGLNLVSNPDEVIFPATNLQNFDIEVFPKTMLIKFLDEFEKLYRNWLDFGFAGTRRLWLEQAFCLKEKIIVKLDEKQIEGIFEDLDEEGNLRISCKGEFLKISAADIFAGQRSDPQKP